MDIQELIKGYLADAEQEKLFATTTRGKEAKGHKGSAKAYYDFATNYLPNHKNDSLTKLLKYVKSEMFEHENRAIINGDSEELGMGFAYMAIFDDLTELKKSQSLKSHSNKAPTKRSSKKLVNPEAMF